MDRHQRGCTEVLGSLNGLLGQHMNIWPVLPILSGFEDGEVERAEAVPDGPEVIFIARIAAQEEVVTGAFQDKGRPICPAPLKIAAREVTGWHGRELDARSRLPRDGGAGGGVDLYPFPPVEFGDTVGRDTPIFEMGAHTQRSIKMSHAWFEPEDGLVIEVVKMVMGQQN